MNSRATPDSGIAESENESNSNESSSKSRAIWMRLLFMVLFLFLYGVTRVVVGAVIIVQILWALFTSRPNDSLSKVGLSLATYTFQMVRFLTFASEERPFPVDSDWPSESAQAPIKQ